jgi:hypothetical protein
MLLTNKEVLQKQLEKVTAQKVMDDADCILKADRNQKEIDKVAAQIVVLEKAEAAK